MREGKLCPRSHLFSFVVQLLSRFRLSATLWTVARQTPLSIGFSRQEYWSGLPFPSPGDLPDPRVKPTSAVFLTGQVSDESFVQRGLPWWLSGEESAFQSISFRLVPPGFPVAQRLKHLPPMWETWIRSPGQEDPLEKEMVTHSSILAWRIPWTEKPGRLQSTGSQRVGHDWLDKAVIMIEKRNSTIFLLLIQVFNVPQ